MLTYEEWLTLSRSSPNSIVIAASGDARLNMASGQTRGPRIEPQSTKR
jgi:hypothetical protein